MSESPEGWSIVRENLMTQPGYAPYCGADPCSLRWPRTVWDGAQFKCPCGWRSGFPSDFIAEYRAKWHDDSSQQARTKQDSGTGAK